ncbi:PepSY-associated TM helix [Planctopirus ephydatiae]|uniref:PepSY-associated TM helix n=1 Tax=Planctopirus ephydatiae TaxID=2528019 RepID=A0A518GJJ6_9PLAN|nr:PepSY domain-containing protein [Planctopirus ephydatiae]QDV28763.1 PepSY-associated TM helix [Planctopirus ephydatiae]
MSTSEFFRYALPAYRTVWRWHFYAGLFTVPFVIILSLSGIVYLFKAEIEDWLDQPYNHLVMTGQTASLPEQVNAALASKPESRFVSYELPVSPHHASRIVVSDAGKNWRIYVHPQTLAVLHAVPEQDRLMRQIFRLHGELMLGEDGSHLVELAASWTIIMILTGLYLWWPRHLRGFGGILYPRFTSGRQRFLRDLHGVTGFWISAFALILLVSGLPWSHFWGDYFREIRKLTGTSVAQQDWSNRSENPQTRPDTSGAKQASPTVPTTADGEHAGHASRESSSNAGESPTKSDRSNRRRNAAPVSPETLAQLPLVVQVVEPLQLPHPVILTPPASERQPWTVKSMTANRPWRETLKIDAMQGSILSRETFSDRHWIDRVVSIGIALHEGRLFGWPNQLLGLLTALGLILLSCTGPLMWWRRRAPGTLGAPAESKIAMRHEVLFALPFMLFVILLGILLPMFGVSLLAVLLIERVILRRIPPLRNWLGLAS